MKFTFLSCLAVAFLAGCSEERRPKGSGASGNVDSKNLKSDAELGLDLVNKLDPKQELANKYLHQPGAVVMKVQDLPESDPDFPKLKAMKDRWDSIEFVQVKRDRVLRPGLKVITSDGEFYIRMIYETAPNHTRGIVAAAREDWFTDVPMTLENGRLVFGKKDQRALIHLEPETVDKTMDPRACVVIAVTDKTNKSVLHSFEIKCDDKPLPIGGITVMGIIPPDERSKVEALIKTLKAKPNSVKLLTVRTPVFDMPLFDGAKVALPTMGSDGKPIPPGAEPPGGSEGGPPAGGPPGASKGGPPPRSGAPKSKK